MQPVAHCGVPSLCEIWRTCTACILQRWLYGWRIPPTPLCVRYAYVYSVHLYAWYIHCRICHVHTVCILQGWVPVHAPALKIRHIYTRSSVGHRLQGVGLWLSE
jgi:hypothetical protein